MNGQQGFTMVELLVSLAIFSMIFLLLLAFIFTLNFANYTTKSDRGALDNARSALDQMTYEIKNAKGIYTPTTTQHQLSLQTTHYLPAGETTTFIDFFLCGSRLCLKKESYDPVAITSDSVQIQSLTFTQVVTGQSLSIKIDMTVNYAIADSTGQGASFHLTSTAALRSY